MKVAVVTAIYDNYDELKTPPPQVEVEVEWICVTDSKDYADRGWQIVYEPRSGVHPNLAAKRAKTQPWLYTDAEASIWLDASFRILANHFVKDAINYANPIAQFKHPGTTCAYSEAAGCRNLPKYESPSIDEQVKRYLAAGFPSEWGFWACSHIARIHTPAVRRFGEQWLQESEYWFSQADGNAVNDQISEPFMLYQTNLRPNEFPGDVYINRWTAYLGNNLRHSNNAFTHRHRS